MRRELAERELTSAGPARRPGVRGKRRTVTVNLAESPLGWLYTHGYLNERLFDAGERLRADYERAQLAPRVTMRWDPVRIKQSGGGSELTPGERQLAAKQRFDGALARAGSDLADVLWRVVCAGETVQAAEKALEWPARSGKLVLKIALDRVAEYYRIG